MRKWFLVALVLIALAPVVVNAGTPYPYNEKIVVKNRTPYGANVYVTSGDSPEPGASWRHLGYSRPFHKFTVVGVFRLASWSYGMDWDFDGDIDDYFWVNLNGRKKSWC